MIEIGKRKIKNKNLLNEITLEKGNAEKLKYKNNNFDVVTICFGVRNFQNLDRCLNEVYRVLKNSGSLIIYETSLPKNLVIRFFYLIVSSLFIPLTGLLLSKNPSAYFYLHMSSKVFPSGKNFLKILSKSGFCDFEIKERLFGSLSIYIAKKK
jgi:demethylmenaquinone methyltransferase/2-methoxy-6-polyprenyl-1,4-benzoquinol methylase